MGLVVVVETHSNKERGAGESEEELRFTVRDERAGKPAGERVRGKQVSAINADGGQTASCLVGRARQMEMGQRESPLPDSIHRFTPTNLPTQTRKLPA